LRFVNLKKTFASIFVNLPPVSNDTSSKFAASVEFAAGVKFAAGVNDTSGNLPLVSMTPMVNLPLVSVTPVVHLEL
jgi:hypothetical protein